MFGLIWGWMDVRLETTLRNFSCLTLGDNIMVAYNNKQYYIDIIESKPAPAISIIETDCEVDFAAPLDYKENKPATAAALPPGQSNGNQSLCVFSSKWNSTKSFRRKISARWHFWLILQETMSGWSLSFTTSLHNLCELHIPNEETRIWEGI